MEGRETALTEVLEFRELKTGIQNDMRRRRPDCVVVSLGMNIPGPVKTNPSIHRAFLEGSSLLEAMFEMQCVEIAEKIVLEENAGCAAVYLVAGKDAADIKREAVRLEEGHLLGRLFDIDVTGTDGSAIVREEIGAPTRTCLICEKDAKECGRSRAHSVQELQTKVQTLFKAWEIAVHIGRTAHRALLEEVYTTPKPGLVDWYSCGAHDDMDVNTFEKSADAIAPWFVRMAAQGYHLRCKPEELFLEIRKTGIAAEQAMYRATEGVNTHKGLIFTIGIFCAAAGRCIRDFGEITQGALIDMERQMTAEVLSRELAEIMNKEAQSHGEKNLQQYGTPGLRGEALEGYPSITQLALPVLRKGIQEKRDWNRIKLQTLFQLMSRTQDSNILSRHNPEELEKVHAEAEFFLKRGGAYAEDAMEVLFCMDADYIKRGISAGGCADLLAASIFLEMLFSGGFL